MVINLIAFGPGVRQYILVGVCGRANHPFTAGSGREKESNYVNRYFLRTLPETVETGSGPVKQATRQGL